MVGSAGSSDCSGTKRRRSMRRFAGSCTSSSSEGAWYDYAPGWLTGHAAMFESLLRSTDWQSSSREMYERVVEVPRLYAGIPGDGAGHPLFDRMRQVLTERYEQPFVRTSLALYRDGSDSVAWHGDYVARNMAMALVATVSVGAARRFLLRPKGGGRSIALQLGQRRSAGDGRHEPADLAARGAEGGARGPADRDHAASAVGRRLIVRDSVLPCSRSGSQARAFRRSCRRTCSGSRSRRPAAPRRRCRCSTGMRSIACCSVTRGRTCSSSRVAARSTYRRRATSTGRVLCFATGSAWSCVGPSATMPGSLRSRARSRWICPAR